MLSPAHPGISGSSVDQGTQVNGQGITSSGNGRRWQGGLVRGLSLPAVSRGTGSSWIRSILAPRPPSLIIFPSVAVTGTLFAGFVMALSSAQLSGSVSGTLGGVLLVLVSLPIALLMGTVLAIVLPQRFFASSSTLVAVLSSYSPYLFGALTGIWGALWLGKMLPFEYDSLTSAWRWNIAIAGAGTWLLVGLVSNHLAGMVERRREYEKGLEELRESRYRIMQVHEHIRKEVAGLLHGRVQSRLVVLGHWLKECQDRSKDWPSDVVETLDNANKLLQEIRDHELRSITRQLYPNIIRMGLPSALNSLADRFRSVFSVDLEIQDEIADLENPAKPKLDESVRLAFYRVAEEALSNVAKYSQATAATVTVGFSSDREVRLTVRDDGRGFDPATASMGQGLLSMEDYATSLGGTLEVRSREGAGTTIVALVPLHSPSPPLDPRLGGGSQGRHTATI